MEKKTVIHWFRKGLRIHDNPALIKAIELLQKGEDKYVFRPIFILDPGIPIWMSVGANRFRFLLQSLEQLHENLKGINSRLYVVRGSPNEVFPRIFKEWNVEVLTFESDIEPYAVTRDKKICEIAQQHNVNVIQELSHTIYNPEMILMKNHGKPIITYQKFLSIVSQLKVPEPLLPPAKLSSNFMPTKDSLERKKLNCYDPPTLEELKVDQSKLGPNLYPGGETESLTRLDGYLSKTQWICNFEKPNTSPNSIEPSTTVLSPYLKFGCLSSRLFYKKLNAVLIKNTKHSKPPVSLMGQLMWREFYTACGAVVPNFDRMIGNSVCYQIDWDTNSQYLEAWTNGKTGYPFIDAIMRQLRQEGWIHHLARHAVACFLTRGDLWISWEEGQKVFEELLLDADWALNAGNWMWLSASAFFHQYFRVYSPVAFGKKTDPEGKYIKKYCPELRKYPSGIIYEPWKANLKFQQDYGCIIGKDYPNRIVIHEEIHKVNIGRMSNAYKRNKDMKASLDDNEFVGTSKKRKAPTPSKSQTIQRYLKKKK